MIKTPFCSAIVATCLFFTLSCADSTDPNTQASANPFPLKVGDQIELVAGGRLTVGDASQERTLRAVYEVRGVSQDKRSGHWMIDADTSFELDAFEIEASALQPLFLSGMLPFAQATESEILVERKSYATDLTMVTDSELKSFPFFDFNPALASEPDGVFAQAAADFRARILQIDPDANIRLQPAASRFEAYFKDSRFGKPYLHELRLLFSPFGFVSNVEERLQYWQDGMQRNVGAFDNVEIAAVFPLPIKLTRDGKTYSCSTFNGKCKTVDGTNLCLARNPAEPPQPCN